MLRDFGRALSEAISDSTEARRRLREIRDQGYSLYLLLDGSAEESPACEVEERGKPTRAVAAGEPSFRINGKDLTFLRSIGIDPTRRLRRRRS